MKAYHQRVFEEAQRRYDYLEFWMQRMIDNLCKTGKYTELTPGQENSMDQIGRHLKVAKVKVPEKLWPL